MQGGKIRPWALFQAIKLFIQWHHVKNIIPGAPLALQSTSPLSGYRKVLFLKINANKVDERHSIESFQSFCGGGDASFSSNERQSYFEERLKTTTTATFCWITCLPLEQHTRVNVFVSQTLDFLQAEHQHVICVMEHKLSKRNWFYFKPEETCVKWHGWNIHSSGRVA